MWQEIAIIIIGILTVLYVGWKIYKMLTTPKDPDNPCSGCSGCSLKDQIKTMQHSALNRINIVHIKKKKDSKHLLSVYYLSSFLYLVSH